MKNSVFGVIRCDSMQSGAVISLWEAMFLVCFVTMVRVGKYSDWGFHVVEAWEADFVVNKSVFIRVHPW